MFLDLTELAERAPRPASAAQPQPNGSLIRDIPYAKPADPKSSRRQTLDLYLPEMSVRRPPLVVFIHGGFWALTDDEYRIGPAFAEALAPSGVADHDPEST